MSTTQTMTFYINNRLTGEVELDLADVADQFLAAVTTVDRYIIASSGWPLERTLATWLGDSEQGLGATWEDRPGFDRLADLALDKVRELPPIRCARVVVTRRSGDGTMTPTPDLVAKYLPSHYAVQANEDGSVIHIVGRDYAGWTMEDYVLPRLGSGLIYAEEITP